MDVRVRATAEALEVIERLRVAHGALVFFQSGGCCEGSAPLCLREGEMAPGSGDVRLGEIGDVPFYIDGDQDQRWNQPAFVIDVSPGAAEGFSLEASEGVHFVSRSAEGDRVAGALRADPEEQP